MSDKIIRRLKVLSDTAEGRRLWQFGISKDKPANLPPEEWAMRGRSSGPASSSGAAGR